jgi:hypothetical protein
MDLGFSLEAISSKARGKERKKEKKESKVAKERVSEEQAEKSIARKISKTERMRILDSIVVHDKGELEELGEDQRRELVRIVVKLLNQIRLEPERPRFPEESRSRKEHIRDRNDRKRKIVVSQAQKRQRK